MDWAKAVEIIQPYVVQILTPSGSGTGFLFGVAKTPAVCGIVTAGHVVEHAYDWEEPIRIRHGTSGTTIVLRPAERRMVVEVKNDLAVLLTSKGQLPFPEQVLELAPEGKIAKIGKEVGWLGFPALPTNPLSFFSGHVSSFVDSHSAYFVDGVAINGVSGGPAFTIVGDKIFLLGIVSAYIANRATGETLPGVSVIRDIERCHAYIKAMRKIEADEQKTQERPESTLQ